MTMHSQSPYGAHSAPRLLLSAVDGGLVILCVLALAVAAGLANFSIFSDGARAVLAATVPAAVLLVPFRIMHGLLRQSCCAGVSIVMAGAIGLAGFAALNHLLRQGPDPSRALALVAHDPPLAPVLADRNATVGLLFLLGDRNLMGDDPAAQGACLNHCRILLQSGLAPEVAMLTSATDAGPATLYRTTNNGRCAQGWARQVTLPAGFHAPNVDVDLCWKRDEYFQPMLSYVVQQLASDATGFEAQWPVLVIHRITIKSGAMSQSVHTVRAATVDGGGLIAPVQGAWQGDDVHFYARPRSAEYTKFDATRTGDLPSHSMDQYLPTALNAVFAQTLGRR